MYRGGDGGLTKSVNLISHYTSKKHIFNLCSVFIYAYFSNKALVICLCSLQTCLERYQSCEGFVLCHFVHIHANCVYTFCHTGGRDSTTLQTEFGSILKVSMPLGKIEERQMEMYNRTLFPRHSFPMDQVLTGPFIHSHLFYGAVSQFGSAPLVTSAL